MHGVIEFHLEGLRFEGKPVPASKSEATYLMRNRLTSSSSNVLVAVAIDRGDAIDGSTSRVDSLIQQASATALIFPAAAAGTWVIPVEDN
jgi:hypothetical protein